MIADAERRSAATSRARPDAKTPPNGWTAAYRRRLVVSDVIVVIVAIFGSQLAWFGFETEALSVRGVLDPSRVLNYWSVSAVLAVAWILLLWLFGTRDARVVGEDVGEYKRILDSAVWIFAAVSVIAYLYRIDFARGFFITAIPAGFVLLALTRALWRVWLRRQRTRGKFSARVLLFGSADSVLHAAQEFERRPTAGYHVVGACVSGGAVGSVLPGSDIPILGGLNVPQIGDLLDEVGADTLAVTSSDALPPQRVRELSWQIVPGRQHIVVAPAITDVGGPRIHTRPVAGLPLVHIETPSFAGGSGYAKRAFDILGSGALLVVLSPLFLVIGLIIKVTSPGPLFYQNERIGLNGEPFGMIKFRSMVVNANDMLAELLAAQGSSDKPLFKIKNDPRITPIGRFIRKYSIDEVPQLVNVLKGDMSLVGPRPQVAGEVELYDDAARRRLLVKPGMTGLWQVSGRSNLDWEDAVRLDLYYVENWSLIGDITILFRTGKAVVLPGDDAH
ncbi:sugar transferase [Microbacteriaceae bacterium VKM Ac-2855]|nr:sugar transferase [Microbacteriaceae bacterium VKM Ac-2855]